MISLLLVALVGFAFGYALVGPINRSYSAGAFAVLMFLVGSFYGFLLFVALVVGTYLDDFIRSAVSIAGLLVTQAFWMGYTGTVALGAYVQQRRAIRRVSISVDSPR